MTGQRGKGHEKETRGRGGRDEKEAVRPPHKAHSHDARPEKSREPQEGPKREEAPKDEHIVPRLRKGIDLSRLNLTAEEGLVAARVDGMTRLGDLALLVAKPAETVKRVLERLATAGVLSLDGSVLDSAEPSSTEESEDDTPYGNFIFSPALMQEEGDLNIEERKRISWFFEQMGEMTHYEILQVRRRDDAKGIKAAYFDRSKEWHPDRFRQKKLGSFKAMIEAIFLRIQNAHQVLSDGERRAAYDATIVFMPEEEEIAEMLKLQRRSEREAIRAQESLERRRRHNPVRARIEKARRFFEESAKLEAQGDISGALRLVQTAVAFDPREEYSSRESALKAAAGELRLGPLLKRGLHHQSMTNWSEAIDAFLLAVEAAPENGEARLRLAYNLLMGGREPHEASPHAQKAAQILPDDPEAHFVLGLCYEKGGMEKAATRAYGRALELRPNYAEVKKRMKRLRWGF